MKTNEPWAEYLRLTQDRSGTKIGYKVQSKANHAWASRSGITISTTFKDPHITAADENVVRDEYERMLADVEAGRFGGIVVWKIDRLMRLVFEYERCLRIAKRARIVIATSIQGVTTETRAGIGMLRQEVSFAEQEIESISDRVTANKRERSSSGLYHGGSRRPFGFVAAKYNKRTGKVTNSGKIGVKHVDTEVALLQEAAERIAWGNESYSDVIKDWHSRTPPIYGATGAPWNPKTLQTILTSPRMIGKQIHKLEDPDTGEVTNELVKASWKKILKKATWDELRSSLIHSDPKATRSRYLLSPVLECGRCHQSLTGAVRKYVKAGVLQSTRTYRCKSMPADKVRGACGALNVLAEPVERIVVAHILARLERSREVMGRIAGYEDLQRQIIEANARIRHLQDELDLLAGAVGLPVAEYLRKRQPIAEEQAVVIARRSLLKDRMKLPVPMDITDFQDLPGWFENLTEGQQKKLVLAHVRNVTVLPPGRSGRYFDPSRVLPPTLARLEELYGEVD